MLDYKNQNISLKSSINSYMVINQQTRHAMSSTLEQKAVERNIIRLNNSVCVIEDMLNELPEKRSQLIELRYFKSYNTEWVAGELNIYLCNFFKWRVKAIKQLAIRLGLI